MVFSTILSCEPASGQRPLLKQCMESLLDTAASPLPTVIDQHKDLPQVLKLTSPATCLKLITVRKTMDRPSDIDYLTCDWRVDSWFAGVSKAYYLVIAALPEYTPNHANTTSGTKVAYFPHH